MLEMQHSSPPQLLPHMRDKTAVFKDSEDFLGKGEKVILITFVGHGFVLKVDREGVALLHRLDPFLKLEDGEALIDRVSKEDKREPLDDSYPSSVQEIGRCAIEGRFVLLSLSDSEVAPVQGGR